jgi:uncharacterized protein (TIGR03067 family)
MKTRIAVGLVVALFGPAFADETSDRDKLQGTWEFVSMKMDGQPALKMDPPGTITFDGDKFTVKIGGMVVQAGTQTLDTSKKPHAVDAKIAEGEGKGMTQLGIYEIDGDTMKACFDVNGKKRPTEFKSTAGSGTMLVVCKRKK